VDPGMDAMTEADVVPFTVSGASPGGAVWAAVAVPSPDGTSGFSIANVPSKKNFSAVMQASQRCPTGQRCRNHSGFWSRYRDCPGSGRRSAVADCAQHEVRDELGLIKDVIMR
jgi:hypothetical protein